jgi:hypothetical protein
MDTFLVVAEVDSMIVVRTEVDLRRIAEAGSLLVVAVLQTVGCQMTDSQMIGPHKAVGDSLVVAVTLLFVPFSLVLIHIL